MDLGLSVAQNEGAQASVCVQMLVDERPSQPRVGGAIMCRACVPRESARFDRARILHEGS